MNNQKRNIAADIIRCLAFFLVVSVHFFLNSGFHYEIVEGKRMYVMVVMRAFFIICVPLFLTLSGYLLRKKELSVKYYKRITKILLTYILSSLACMTYSIVFLHQELPVVNAISKLLDFTGAPYSWYIEMYIGLFLIIPFLNILYNNIPSQKWKLCLVITFAFLTAFPSVINVYDFTSASWWVMPSASGVANKLIPAWWVGIYPVTYYFIGCYLGEYGFKMKKSLSFLLIVLFSLASGTYSYWRSYKSVFVWGSWCDYYSLFSVILTVLVFGLIININFDRVPEKISRFIQKISGLCLGAYLVSWIFDSRLYNMLSAKVPVMTDRLEYYFIMVPSVFVLSLVLSYIISKIQWLIEKSIEKILHLSAKKHTDINNSL